MERICEYIQTGATATYHYFCDRENRPAGLATVAFLIDKIGGEGVRGHINFGKVQKIALKALACQGLLGFLEIGTDTFKYGIGFGILKSVTLVVSSVAGLTKEEIMPGRGWDQTIQKLAAIFAIVLRVWESKHIYEGESLFEIKGSSIVKKILESMAYAVVFSRRDQNWKDLAVSSIYAVHTIPSIAKHYLEAG